MNGSYNAHDITCGVAEARKQLAELRGNNNSLLDVKVRLFECVEEIKKNWVSDGTDRDSYLREMDKQLLNIHDLHLAINAMSNYLETYISDHERLDLR